MANNDIQQSQKKTSLTKSHTDIERCCRMSANIVEYLKITFVDILLWEGETFTVGQYHILISVSHFDSGRCFSATYDGLF